MTPHQKQAVATASDRLEAIERYTRKTAFWTRFAVWTLVPIVVVMCGAAAEYLRILVTMSLMIDGMGGN